LGRRCQFQRLIFPLVGKEVVHCEISRRLGFSYEGLSDVQAKDNDRGVALADGNNVVLAGFDISQFDAEDFLI